MPLMSDFFKLALKIAPDFARPLVHLPIWREFGIRPADLRRDAIGVEELLTAIDCSIHWRETVAADEAADAVDKSVAETRKAHLPVVSRRGRTLPYEILKSNLLWVISAVLLRAQQPVIARGAPIHAQLVTTLQPGDVVISYNYDLIADSALAQSTRLSALPLKRLLGRSHGKCPWQAFGLVGGKKCITYLKLHGSLNWLISGLADDPAELQVSTDLDLPDETGVAADLGLYAPNFLAARPLIHVPATEKGAVWREYGGALRRLWHLAHVALAECNDLAIIGYSLRSTDYLSQWLFRSGLAGRRLRTISIVNPSRTDRTRLKSFFDHFGRVSAVTSMERYLSARAA
jgi:hypothetical protein